MTHSLDASLATPPRLTILERQKMRVLIDPDAPNWLATGERGAWILRRFGHGATVRDVIGDYGREFGLGWERAWLDVDTVVADASRQKFLLETRSDREPYSGRRPFVEGHPLTELWLHTNNSCNLSCSHCLVSSGPDGDRGLPTERLLELIDEARRLGVNRFYFTGGEPLIRPDFERLASAALADSDAELAILTNGILLRGNRLERLQTLDRERVRLQISLDGSTPELNDPIRGRGSFGEICAGIRTGLRAGFRVTVTTAITETNVHDVPSVTRLVAELGGDRHHLLWLHKRGRAAGDDATDRTPDVAKVASVVREARAAGRSCGVEIDNVESLKDRLNAPAGSKRDLSNACVASLCVYSDGTVYPSAATAGVPELALGSILDRPLADVWHSSPVTEMFRAASVTEKAICRECPLQLLCGGGDLEHSYFYGGSVKSHDPYCRLHESMIHDALFERAEERRAIVPEPDDERRPPIVWTGMGEGSVHCASGEPVPEVLVSHSECVLSFEIDAPRKLVREFYGGAAEAPQADLCCPTQPDPQDLSHIPSEVVDRFYGCGSPVEAAAPAAGETLLDLGSGAGIDVFIAARRIGSTGRAVGVDMTDQMLAVANASKVVVSERLGYDNTEFRKGFLEEIPAEDRSVDVVTSNCVVNLSPDKKRVFAEIARVLRPGGRVVLSDIVSAVEVPPEKRRDPRLWGECISGALTEEELLAIVERSGFHAVEVLERTFWREVEGFGFHSVTLRAFRSPPRSGTARSEAVATYLGPFKSVLLEDGLLLPRGLPVAVDRQRAEELASPQYRGAFRVEGAGLAPTATGSEEEDDSGRCGTGCC